MVRTSALSVRCPRRLSSMSEFLIPQRGIFAIARAFLEKRDNIVPVYRIQQDTQPSRSV